MPDWLLANRDNWDDRVPIHVASPFYDVEGWLAGDRLPPAWEAATLGDVAGLDVVHLQCHFGLDALRLATAGAAHVTGLDLSPVAVAEARRLAERAGLADRTRFVESDVRRAAEVLAPATFDLVSVTLGSLCWLPSVAEWADQVAALLRPGGRLHLHESHPLSWALADDELCVARTCFEEPEPFVDDEADTDTDDDARVAHTRTYEWNHAVGEVVTALLERGLRLDRLVEHDWTLWRRFEWLARLDDGRWAPPAEGPRLPLSYTVVATLTR